jgi:hypothetical protein
MDKDGLIDALRHIVVTPEQKILTTTEGEVKSG